jgi:hypothetical protein
MEGIIHAGFPLEMHPADQNQEHRSNHYYRGRPTLFSVSLFCACRRISNFVDPPACHVGGLCRDLKASPVCRLNTCQSHLDKRANSFGTGGGLVAFCPPVDRQSEFHR